jgi:hypothetical protein
MPAHLNIFKKYLNPWFIETGTFQGEGIQCALDAGFQNIKSIEIHQPYHQANLIKYYNMPQVKQILLGSTEDQLWNAIKDINEPMTFWLDAHFSGNDTPKSDVNCPLLRELEIIKQHPLAWRSTILIDDIRCCGTELFDGIKIEQLCSKVWEINRELSIWFEDSWEPRDILIAKIK